MEGLGYQVTRVDALSYDLPIKVDWKGIKGQLHVWREQGKSSGVVEGNSEAGFPVMTSGNKGNYLCGWPDDNLLSAIMREQMISAGLKPITLPHYLRVRRRGNLLFFTNYGKEIVDIPDYFEGDILLGSKKMKQADVTILESKK